MALKALVLPIETPPGFPWRQRQVAMLEAQHNSPMPLDRVAVLLARRSPWRVGRVGVFQAAIVRSEDLPSDGDFVDIETGEGPVSFSTTSSASFRRIAPTLVAVSLTVIALASLMTFGVRASQAPREPRVAAAQPGKAKLRIQQQNADLIADLIAAKQAFGGGQGIQSIEWRASGMMVEVAKSDATSATGDGRAFEKQPAVKGSNIDRWRLAPTAHPGAASAR